MGALGWEKRRHILKQDTNMRDDSAKEMCSLTLRSLAGGESFRSLESQFRIGRKTVSRNVMDATTAIFHEFSWYLLTPKTKDEWLSISQKF